MTHKLEVHVTHSPTVTRVVERYVPSENKYQQNRGRKPKGQEYYTLKQHEQAEETRRCSVANSKRTLKGIINANYFSNFCMLTLTFSPRCEFDITDFATCREKFNSFWKKLKRCKRLNGIDLRYVGVTEFQGNDHIHFHILCRIPKQFISFLKSKWTHGGLYYREQYGTAEDNMKIASYLSKGIYDKRLPRGKKRYLGGYGLERPVRLKFKSRKIMDFLLQRNGKILNSFESPYGFTQTVLVTDAAIDELESFAEAQDEELTVELLEKLENIQQTFI
ncbi:hypothetical protein MHH70_16300 [Metasolibacillus sp. FSL H7-0170]|uniref:rolling circle replication-associated protein n=1 Tax=Metasolibacillus sp. FSL H7-0170 TaxID=2921431 RepID=UPI003159656E